MLRIRTMRESHEAGHHSKPRAVCPLCQQAKPTPLFGNITRDVRVCGPAGDVTYHAGYPCHRITSDGDLITPRVESHDVRTERAAFEPHPAYAPES